MSLIQLKCVVTGLEGTTAASLVSMLTSMNHVVSESSQQISEADMVFCDAQSMQPIARKTPTSAKIVAVGSHATEESWLNALEQGATDYLPMPCQPAELNWILQSHFGVQAPQVA